MRMTLTRAIVGAAGVLALTGVAATPALAAPSAHQAPEAAAVKAAPAASGNIWYDNKDNGDTGEGSVNTTQWFAQVVGDFIGPAVSCSTGWCEHKTESGTTCLTWQSASNTVTDNACQGLSRQLWATNTTSEGGGGTLWQNQYADLQEGCTTALTSNSLPGNAVTLHCYNGANGNPGFSQVWKAR